MDAVRAHAETYLAEKGDAKAHLSEIFKNKARSALRRASRQRETLGEDISDEWINLRFDIASDTSNALLEVEGIEQKQLLLHIWKNWAELPNYPWKDTLRMYFDWMFFTDCSSESRIGEFIKHCSRSGILDKPEATIYRHVATGKAELAKWLHAGESPLSVQERPKIAIKCGMKE